MSYPNEIIYNVFNKKNGVLVFTGKIGEVSRYVMKNSALSNSEFGIRAYIQFIADCNNKSYGGYKYRVANAQST